ncbi:MAG TPA: glycosyltransferase family 2 protein [Pyrinomonadaceae bacterium]|nr:glycosyltransferase family 2 protein [Pyrinomonadaceae bacterium]
MLAFYFAVSVVVWLGILSLRNGFSFAAYVAEQLRQPPSDYTPFASVIAPTRGLDLRLHENLEPLLSQNYPEYEVIFVTDRSDDPSVPLIERVIKQSARPARIVIAGDAVDSGQKVHNLRVAVSHVHSKCDVLVFVDTDARPHKDWLRSLVAPLKHEDVGAATGYRWFIPASASIASHLRSVWNASIASALGARGDKNFCWGGSTAIRRTTFERLRVSERWHGTVSDDFTVTRVLQEAKLPIHFVPQCLVPSLDDCNLAELLEFTNRQLKITRTYAPHLWKSVLIGSLIFTTVFFGGLIMVITRAAQGRSFVVPLLLLLIVCLLGGLKSYVRLRAVAGALQAYRKQLFRSLPAHVLLWPIASALFLLNAVVAACSRRITWRGITYELKSATEAVIIQNKQ